jgi:hypothetical protein
MAGISRGKRSGLCPIIGCTADSREQADRADFAEITYKTKAAVAGAPKFPSCSVSNFRSSTGGI